MGIDVDKAGWNTTRLLVGFAAFGLMLAALGIYAVVSYAVSQRRQEFALRMALGATPADIRASVLAQTARLTLIGFAAGLPAAWLAARMARAMLCGVAPTDPVTILGVIALLEAALSFWLPTSLRGGPPGWMRPSRFAPTRDEHDTHRRDPG